jgi:hypothetical protein
VRDFTVMSRQTRKARRSAPSGDLPRTTATLPSGSSQRRTISSFFNSRSADLVRVTSPLDKEQIVGRSVCCLEFGSGPRKFADLPQARVVYDTGERSGRWSMVIVATNARWSDPGAVKVRAVTAVQRRTRM